jgi:hypothetical protein
MLGAIGGFLSSLVGGSMFRIFKLGVPQIFGKKNLKLLPINTMDPEPIKPSSSHLEGEEDQPLFLKSDQELSVAGLIKTHWRALLLCTISSPFIFTPC